MAIVAHDTGKDFEPAPEGLHPAVCVDVVDLGSVTNKFGSRHAVDIVWQIDCIMKESGKRFLASKRYTLSLHEKANLRKDLESWRGKPFQFDELAQGFDLEVLIGVNCELQIMHNTKDNRTFANINSVLPHRSSNKIMKPVDYIRRINREGYAEPQAVGNDEPFEATEEDVPF